MTRQSVILLPLLLAGCSGKPGEALIQNLMTEQISKEMGEGTAKIENLKKVNGFEKSENTYLADVEFDLIFQKSLAEVIQGLPNQTDGQPFGGLGAGLNAMAIRMTLGDFKAGDSKHIERQITLIKTEQGWRLSAKQ